MVFRVYPCRVILRVSMYPVWRQTDLLVKILTAGYLASSSISSRMSYMAFERLARTLASIYRLFSGSFLLPPVSFRVLNAGCQQGNGLSSHGIQSFRNGQDHITGDILTVLHAQLHNLQVVFSWTCWRHRMKEMQQTIAGETPPLGSEPNYSVQ